MNKLFRCIKNYFFCKKYPFWRQTNVWTGKYLGYSFTWYDDIPEGWQKAFGKQLSDEIKEAGQKYLKEHKGKKWKDILYWEQIKEKWGELCLYASAIEEIRDILDKYELLSVGYCICCGKPARYVTEGWVSFQCEDCFTSYCKEYDYSDEEIEEAKKDCRLTKKDLPERICYEYKQIGTISASKEKQYNKEVSLYREKEDIFVRDLGFDTSTNLYKGEILKLIEHKVDLRKEYGVDFNKLWGLEDE